MTLRAKDIAKLLKLSPTTISLVMNNKPGISDETRKMVEEKLNEFGYGHLLKRNKNYEKNIAFVVYKRHGEIIMESPFFSLLIESIDMNVRKKGYNLLIIYIDKSTQIDLEIERLKQGNCEGLIIFATEMLKDDIAPFHKLNIPFVIIDNYFYDEPIDSVSINNTFGAWEAVNYLVSMGHKKIGYLKSKIFIHSFDQRLKSFFAALENCGISGMEKYIYEVGYPEDNTYNDFKKILENGAELPSALFADNDLIAFGASKALKEYGYKIPDDISLIGFDDRPICQMMEPNLTTINVPKDIFGNTAVDMLTAKIENLTENNVYFSKVEVGTKLIERNSVKKIQ